MEADFANVSMQCLSWAAVCVAYLYHGWDNALVAAGIMTWMKSQMILAQMARIRQNKALNYLIGRIDKEQLLASDTAKEPWGTYLRRLFGLVLLTSWHNVRLGKPYLEDYAEVLSLKESVMDDVEEEMVPTATGDSLAAGTSSSMLPTPSQEKKSPRVTLTATDV